MSLRRVIESFTKKDLKSLLMLLKDTERQSSQKTTLVDQVLQHNAEDVLLMFTSNQLKKTLRIDRTLYKPWMRVTLLQTCVISDLSRVQEISVQVDLRCDGLDGGYTDDGKLAIYTSPGWQGFQACIDGQDSTKVSCLYELLYTPHYWDLSEVLIDWEPIGMGGGEDGAEHYIIDPEIRSLAQLAQSNKIGSGSASDIYDGATDAQIGLNEITYTYGRPRLKSWAINGASISESDFEQILWLYSLEFHHVYIHNMSYENSIFRALKEIAAQEYPAVIDWCLEQNILRSC